MVHPKNHGTSSQQPGPSGAGAHGACAAAGVPYRNENWWPNRLDLRALRCKGPKGDPSDPAFDYAAEFERLDVAAIKREIETLLTTSQDFWPADYGHYGGLMIRLAWHSVGTYRVVDGRGGAAWGALRFAPLDSWPDNVNLDKARRLLWPVKQKYGRSLSWGDLMILTGNVALESMGFRTLGFGGGRDDAFEPTEVDWGPEAEWLGDERFESDGKTLTKPLAATQMGLVYVNPEGPQGRPDPLAAAEHIRVAFDRMGMNDEETVALIAGGHTLGKAHGAHIPADCLGPVPEGAAIEQQGLGWKNSRGAGNGADTVSSGLEGAWTTTPAKWSHDYFSHMFGYEWELVRGPGGAQQWAPKGDIPATVPDAHDATKRHRPMMFTTDLALKEDPKYRDISLRFHEHPDQFEAAFAKAWFKLTHRDMGPRTRLLGKEVPPAQIWQDPVPAATYAPIGEAEEALLQQQILASGLTISELVRTAWAAASTFRQGDRKGGANGARIRFAPQKDWEANRPEELAKALAVFEGIQTKFNASAPDGKQVSLADLIVLGGTAAIEQAAKWGGYEVKVPFSVGRTDATEAMTDAASLSVLEPVADGFRNYLGPRASRAAPEMLVDKADALLLTVPEMVVLVGGLRVLGANYDGSAHGVFTSRPGTLTNDFFVGLLSSHLDWTRTAPGKDVFEAKEASTGNAWTGTSVDLIFGSNSQLRAVAEVYASDDAKKKFVDDFVAAWVKVMNLDRFDLPGHR